MIHYLSFVSNCSFARYVATNVTSSEEKEKIVDLEKNIIKCKAQLHDIDQTLPQKNGTYLKVRTCRLDSNPPIARFRFRWSFVSIRIVKRY